MQHRESDCIFCVKHHSSYIYHLMDWSVCYTWSCLPHKQQIWADLCIINSFQCNPIHWASQATSCPTRCFDLGIGRCIYMANVKQITDTNWYAIVHRVCINRPIAIQTYPIIAKSNQIWILMDFSHNLEFNDIAFHSEKSHLN